MSVGAVKANLRALFEKFGVDGLPQNQKRVALAEQALSRGAVHPGEMTGPPTGDRAAELLAGVGGGARRRRLQRRAQMRVSGAGAQPLERRLQLLLSWLIRRVGGRPEVVALVRVAIEPVVLGLVGVRQFREERLTTRS